MISRSLHIPSLLAFCLVLCGHVSGRDPIRRSATPEPAAPANSQSAPGNQRLDLRGCIEIALQNNYGLAIKRLEVVSAHDDVEIAVAAFEPSFFLRTDRTEEAGLLGERDTYLSSTRVGFDLRTLTGATVELSASTLQSYEFLALPSEEAQQPQRIRFQKVSVYDSNLELTVRQPLLRGAGIRVNRIPIELGLIGVNQANFDLRRAVLDLLQATENAYWQVAYAIQDYDVREKTLGNSERLIEETKARVKVGLATKVDTLQAQAALASRREAVIISRKAIDDRTDELLLLMSKLGENQYTLAVPPRFPSVSPAPTPDPQRAVEIVRQLPEYQQQVEAIKQNKLFVDKARNNYLPVLDLTFGGGYVGHAGSVKGSFSDALDRKNHDWQTLVEVQIPLTFRAERAELSKSRNALEAGRIALKQVEQQLHASLRETVRAVAAGRERVKVTQTALRLNEQEYEQFVAKFKEGLANFRETLLVQDDLEEAHLAALNAQLDAVLADVRLARLDGSLLLRHQLTWSQ